MACIGPHPPDTLPSSYPRARKPALISSHCSPYSAEAEGLVHTRIRQFSCPPSDPCLFQDLRSVSPATSDSSASESLRTADQDQGIEEHPPSPGRTHSAKSGIIPQPIARDPRRRATYLKARAHYARDRKLQQLLSAAQNDGSASTEEALRKEFTGITIMSPKPSLSAFVIDEEMASQLEARADTPHLSERTPGDELNLNQVIPADGVEAHGLGADVEVARSKDNSNVVKRTQSDRITSIPNTMEKGQ